MLATLFTTLALLAGASAAPAPYHWTQQSNSSASWQKPAPANGTWLAANGTWSTPTPLCAGLTLPLPANQTVLAMPAGQSVTLATVSRGVQNYTCTNGAWVSAGALANLYDVGALLEATAPVVSSQKLTDGLAPLFLAAQPFPASNPPPTLQHEFVQTPQGLLPRFFDPNSNASVTLSKTGVLASPDNSTADITWLQLTAVDGDLAKSVFRLQTAGGQPAGGNCSDGAQASVDYAAMYYFLS
ncbi:uncharacterized protein LOC62_02G003284 [Vanrija pseudolonga]|uniref:Uncharacterized protein n=1 Tax=Vanrija pseudolonga TaxID=143232 RepID=A0AAF1BKM1_9TREE|nr:hypothetical protein LOC62_02G003284 [Vanrija pseudolonga]